MNMEFFAESLAEICSHSLIAPGRQLRWVIIANPCAGGFVMRSRREKSRRMLEKCRAAARAKPLREDCIPAQTAAARLVNDSAAALAACGLIPTRGPDCAAEITGQLMNEVSAALDNAGTDSTQSPVLQAMPFYLLITAGGDGTFRGALSVLYHAPASVRSNIAILRLPLGTGNDGADFPQLDLSLELLIKPSQINFTPALRLLPAPGGPADRLCRSKGLFLAFNILSVGLDAFVTHMTNKMKGKFPGDFYKLWVDIASLLYDRLYKVGFLDVRALDGQGREALSFREKLLLLAVGVSGHRTYGSQKKILPDDRNVCAIKQMSLLRKLALKDLFAVGGHISKPESILFNAHRVEISSEYPILAQMDGEAVLLQKEDFPAVIELSEPVIPVLIFG
jgi:diacylglycerol kinase family enzyme